MVGGNRGKQEEVEEMVAEEEIKWRQKEMSDERKGVINMKRRREEK